MLASRRAFLKSSAALPAVGLHVAPRSAIPAPTHSSFDPWVEVHAGHLRDNVAAVHRHAGRPVLAVIKNNGYGAGVVNVARVLQPLKPVAGFAVVKLQEAIALRDAGIAKPILLMGPVDESELLEPARRDISLMVYTPLTALARLASRGSTST
jgi:alanine racemase